MGTLIRFTSERLLLQREDQPAALDALKKHLDECPGDFDLDRGLEAHDLVRALRVGGWRSKVNRHGDIVGLDFVEDKVPRNATEAFPYYILRALAPHIRYGAFVRWEEQVPGLTLLSVGRKEAVHDYHIQPLRLVQLGQPPSVRPGSSADVTFRLVGYGREEGMVHVEARSGQANCDLDRSEIEIGGTGTVRVAPKPGAAEPFAVQIGLRLEPSSVYWAKVTVHLDAPAGPPEAGYEVLAGRSALDDEERIALGMPLEDHIAVVDLQVAHEALRRYAVRNVEQPHTGFLREVLTAPDLRSALRAACLDIEFTHSGAASGFRFIGNRLPGPERHLWGLFASLEGTVTGDGAGFGITYAHDPRQWVDFTYLWGPQSREWGEPFRVLQNR